MSISSNFLLTYSSINFTMWVLFCQSSLRHLYLHWSLSSQ